MLDALTLQEMMDVGAHFGHQTRRWNPKMKPYLFGSRSGVHIIDLQKTLGLADRAFKAAEDIVARGESILFVGTKEQAQKIIESEAIRCKMPYVAKRWLGGMLTNFPTIKKSVERLIELEQRREKNDFAGFTKKELLNVDREIEKLELSLGGVKNLRKSPGAVFVVDPFIEKIAVHEAKLLGIPVIAVADSNCDPDPIDYVIPANDDAMKSIQIFVTRLADACLRGEERRQKEIVKEETFQKVEREKEKKPFVRTKKVEQAGTAYVSKPEASAENEKVESFSATPETE